MRLSKISQREFTQSSNPYDLVVCASGYESRARHVAAQLYERGVAIARKYVFAFTEHAEAYARRENDDQFKRMGYTLLPCSGHSTTQARERCEIAISSLGDIKSARLLVDISCMTRAWYGEIVHILLTLPKFQELHVDFAYTLAEFAPPLGEYPPNRVAGPVPGFVGMALPDKPTVLGIGLGYHRDRAIGLKDYLDPKRTVLFYSNPSTEPRYVESVRTTNEQILNEESENNIIAYPVNDCVMTFSILNSFCEGMMRNSRVVLCSLGPKIFGLCCFLVAAIHRDISIWRVGAGDHEAPFDHKPTGTPLLLETIWSTGD